MWSFLMFALFIGLAIAFGQVIIGFIIYLFILIIAVIAAAIGGIVNMFKGDDER